MIRIGVSGWSFDEWKETFYEGVPRSKWLGHYAAAFPTVEVNYTFRRTMAASTAEKWRDTVGADFRFAVKAHQRITHSHRLREPADDLPHFLSSLHPLGEQLGPVLFQLPPHLPRDDERLSNFLAHLPEHLSPVFEFRHDTWFAEPVYDVLRASGAGLVLSETDDTAVQEIVTAPVVYLRLRKSTYTDGDLRQWAARLVEIEADSVWAFVKHEEQSPKLAAKLTELVEAIS